MTKYMEPRPDPPHLPKQGWAAKAEGVEVCPGRAVGDKNVDVVWYRSPPGLSGLGTRVLKRPVAMASRLGAAIDAQSPAVGARDGGVWNLQVYDVAPVQSIAPCRLSCGASVGLVEGAVQQQVMVPGDDDLDGVRLGSQSGQGGLKLLQRARLCQVPGVEEDVRGREAGLGVVRVGNAHDRDGVCQQLKWERVPPPLVDEPGSQDPRVAPKALPRTGTRSVEERLQGRATRKHLKSRRCDASRGKGGVEG